MLGLIFEEIEDYVDLVIFAFSCKYLLALGYPHMLRKRRELLAPWAGDAIICLGDYATDLPDKEEIPKAVADEFMDAFDDDELDIPYTWDPPNSFATLNWFPRRYHLHQTLYEWFDNRPFFRHSLGWTLRNLSTRQYVRDDAINIDARRSITLGQALAFRCGWSQDNSTSTLVEGLNEGRWAGDRFDIVLHDKDAEWAKEWEDISLEVAQDIKKAYIAEGLLPKDSN